MKQAQVSATRSAHASPPPVALPDERAMPSLLPAPQHLELLHSLWVRAVVPMTVMVAPVSEPVALAWVLERVVK